MSAPENDVVYGLLTLAGIDVALPLSALREVVPCPPDLAALPADAPGLLGAMSLRALVLPVVDLRAMIGRPMERQPDQVVVVVAHSGRVLGLLADHVRGVTQLPPSALLAMAADGEELLFSHTFRHPASGEVVSVLDAAAVLHRPGLPTVADTSGGVAGSVLGAGGESQAGRTGRVGGPGVTLTLVRCGPYVLALDVVHVHTTLPTPVVRPSVLDSTLCQGVTEFANCEVPVVDPLVLLGLGELAPEDAGAGLVLDLGQGYVVLALTALLDLTPIAAEDVLPVPAFAVSRPDLLAGMIEVEGAGQCLVLDGAALLAEGPLGTLASVNTSLDTPGDPGAAATSLAKGSIPTSAEGEAAAVRGPSYLTYTAGVDVATPLEQIAEILPVPADTTKTAVGGGVLGMIVHRHAAVPVLCLATLLGRTAAPTSPSSCLLLIEYGDGEQVAFVVDAIRAISPLAWSGGEQPVRGGGDDGGRTLRSAPLVELVGEARLIPDLDLRKLAEKIRGVPAAPPAPPVPELVGAPGGR